MSAREKIRDPVSRSSPGAAEIGFEVPDRYNASRILFDNIAAGLAAKTAVLSSTGDASYAELCEAACRAGKALKAAGLKHFDRVLMLLDDTAVYPAAFFGALRARFVPVMINTQSPAELVAYYLADSDARVAIIEAALSSSITAEAVAKSRLALIVVANGEVPGGLPVEAVTWDEWIASASAHLPEARTGRNDMAFWMYSSGSTGRPKGIVHLHHDMAYTYQSYGRRVLGIREDDICFSPPKIFFAYGLGNSLTFPFSAGATTVLNPGRPDPAAVFGSIERYRPTLFFGLPTLYSALLADKRSAEADLSSIRRCISAAEVLSDGVSSAWRQRFGHEIIEGLGSTELLHIYLSNMPGSTRPGASGCRVPGYEVKLTDNDGHAVGPGGVGTLWVRGDSSAPVYWNKPDKTAQTMRRDWIYTGDRFMVDDDGFYYFQGRADDLIKVSGQWVYPLEIERCLAEHPAVRECAVLGVEMADKRMTTQAFVVLNKGEVAGGTMTTTLQEFVKGRLLPFKYPRFVAYLDSLPKTGTGKVDRQDLRALIPREDTRQKGPTTPGKGR